MYPTLKLSGLFHWDASVYRQNILSFRKMPAVNEEHLSSCGGKYIDWEARFAIYLTYAKSQKPCIYSNIHDAMGFTCCDMVVGVSIQLYWLMSEGVDIEYMLMISILIDIYCVEFSMCASSSFIRITHIKHSFSSMDNTSKQAKHRIGQGLKLASLSPGTPWGLLHQWSSFSEYKYQKTLVSQILNCKESL